MYRVKVNNRILFLYKSAQIYEKTFGNHRFDGRVWSEYAFVLS